MILPSKELLSAVLDKEVIWRDIENSDLNYTQDNRLYEGDINIYELMHLMKEWARVLEYDIETSTEYIGVELDSDLVYHSNSNDTEFEAVTKACEWILKEN